MNHKNEYTYKNILIWHKMRIRKIPLRHMWSKNKTRIRQRNLPFTIKDALNHIQQENVFKPLIILMLR